eukprot:1579343-Rhodomonas_salina.2
MATQQRTTPKHRPRDPKSGKEDTSCGLSIALQASVLAVVRADCVIRTLRAAVRLRRPVLASSSSLHTRSVVTHAPSFRFRVGWFQSRSKQEGKS